MTATTVELMTRRAASFEPSSFDAENRTVDVVFSTGADVVRSDYEGQYIERLAMGPENVDLSQLQGAPVLDNHDRYSGVDAILGAVDNARVEGGRGIARIRFGSRPKAQGVAADVQAGIIRNVSAGYTVEKWEVSKRADGMRIKTATRWTPKEISFTAIGADPGATIRTLPTPKDTIMDRDTQIRAIAEAVRVPSAFADGLIARSEVTIDQARTELINEAARTLPTITNRQPAIVTPAADPESWTRAAAEALFLRINPRAQVSEQARPLVGLRLADIARHQLRERGLSALGSDAEVITRSLHTTSDFSNLLSNLSNKVLAAAYGVAPSGMKTVCRQSTANDFKAKNILRRGEMPMLAKVNEHGEFTRATTNENKESYSIDTFGKIFGMTRKALINDDLGAFSDVVSSWGLAAMEFENSFLVDTLTANSGGGPKLADTQNLFHSTHGNLAGSGGAIGDSTLTAARLALRTMKGLSGTIPISATPKYLVVPAAIETLAEKYLSTIYAATAATVNPFPGKLELIVDPRLDAKSATRWYVFADPAILPVIEYSYLSGFEGLQVETRNGFDVDGVEIKARLDFGAGGIDHRGAYMNPGA
jgi:hypothetical protein